MELHDVMTPNPIMLTADTSVADAATLMRDQDVGDVLVEKNGELYGIVTDRDIVTRAVAEQRDVTECVLGDICTSDLEAATVDMSVDDVIGLMSERNVRRIPVLDNGQPVGIVSLGDLAVQRDRQSLLGDISAAPSSD